MEAMKTLPVRIANASQPARQHMAKSAVGSTGIQLIND